MAKFLPHNVANESKFYNRSLNSMLPTMPVPVETIQSAEVTQTSSLNNSGVVGSNPCKWPFVIFDQKVSNVNMCSKKS